MADNSKQYKEAMKQLEALVKKQEALRKSTESLNKSWDAISSQVFKLSGAEWFEKVPRSVEDIKKINDQIKDLDSNVRLLEEAFDQSLDQDANYQKLAAGAKGYFEEYKKGLEGIEEDTAEYHVAQMNAQKQLLTQLRADHKELSSMSDEELVNITKHLAAGGKLSQVYQDLSKESKNLLISNAQNSEEMLKFKFEAEKASEEISHLNGELAKGDKEIISWKKGLSAMFSNIASEGIGALMAFDNTINKIQKDTGIMMDDNDQAFGDLTRNVAQFGVSVEQAGQFMADMSDELNTTNFSVLSKAAEDLTVIEGATGASSKDITNITGQLMRMGQSSEEVRNYFEDANQMAQKFGISSKKAIEGISRNIKKMREMGFVGGEKSLQRMVVTAEKLNMNVDEIFDVAKRARTIEGAMEMASELQLAGGSFANINPMDLLAAARKGPEELQKILTSMGGDIGRFNKETGEYEFDPVDVDRLQMVADATGQSLDSIMNGIQKSGLDKQKLEPFAGMLDGLDEADKALMESSISDMMKWDEEKGAFVLDAESDMAKRMGIDSLEELQSMSADDLKTKLEEDAKNLEAQNKANQSFQDALQNFWKSIQSLFYIFQPVLEMLTWALQGITSLFTSLMNIPILGDILKWAIPILLLFGTKFAASVFSFITKGIGGFAKNIKDVIASKGKSLFSLGGKTETDTPKSKTDMGGEGPKKGIGEGFKSLAEGLKAMGSDNSIFKGIAAVALAGPALLLFAPALPGLLVMALIGVMGQAVYAGFSAVAEGIGKFGSTDGVFKGALAMAAVAVPLLLFTVALPGLLVMALIGTMAPLIEAGFKAIASGIGYMGQNLGDVMKGSLALLVIGLAMTPFVLAAVMMSDVDWLNVLAGVGVMLLVLVALIGVGLIAMTVGWLILAGAALLATAGIAMAIAALGLMAMGEAFAMLQDIDASKIGELSLAMLALGPGLLAFAFAVMLLNFVSFEPLKALGTAISELGMVDPGNLSALGQALGSLGTGLMAFGFSALLFLNPIMLLGMMMMVWILDELAQVMTPLANALSLGSESLNGFAEGLEKLSAAADALSDEKLEKLQKISEAMAAASASGNIASVMAAVSGAGGEGGGGGVRKIEVDVKLNGRELQNYIVKDTAIVK